ncbi:unnamed protein product, partial [Polarella glacialis]
DSARPSLQIQVPLSSRGTPGRKAMVSIAVTGASGSMVNTSIQSLEPEAEPGASTQQAGTAQSKAATAAILAAAAAAAAGYCNTRATSSTASLAMAAAAAAAAFEGGQCQYTMGDQDRRFFGEPEETLHSANLLAPRGDDHQFRVLLLPSQVISWSDLQIEYQINEGSFGEVFLARYRGEEVSVKRCKLGLGPSSNAAMTT